MRNICDISAVRLRQLYAMSVTPFADVLRTHQAYGYGALVTAMGFVFPVYSDLKSINAIMPPASKIP